jgi:UDP-perosamine 4-acetyltransferase
MVLKQKVVIIGAGGHAKVIIDMLRHDPELEIVGCTDYRARGRVSDVQILGDDSILAELYLSGIHHAFVAIGDNLLRQQLAKTAAQIGFHFVNAISPLAYVAESVQLGIGLAVMAGSVIQIDAQIGDHTIINTNASVDHDCKIGSYCHIAPGSTLSGKVVVGKGAFIGTGTKVIDEIHIGEWSVMGAGAVVIEGIPARCLAVGVPARVIRNVNISARPSS